MLTPAIECAMSAAQHNAIFGLQCQSADCGSVVGHRILLAREPPQSRLDIDHSGLGCRIDQHNAILEIPAPYPIIPSGIRRRR